MSFRIKSTFKLVEIWAQFQTIAQKNSIKKSTLSGGFDDHTGDQKIYGLPGRPLDNPRGCNYPYALEQEGAIFWFPVILVPNLFCTSIHSLFWWKAFQQ